MSENIQPFEARTIIESLRKGVVPVAHVPRFSVGRERWLSYIRSDLRDFIAHGGSKVRFINGDYGDGKTHFMSVIGHLAREAGFAVSFVVLTREVPLHKFELVYRDVARQLQGRPASGAVLQRGIRALAEAWVTQLDGPSDTLADVLRALPGMDLSFANALTALADLHHAPLAEGETAESRAERREVVLRWLEGDRIAKRTLRPLAIHENLDKTNSKRFLTSLVAWLRHLGHAGLVLLLDEVETVMARSSSLRNAAYENIRLLIDSTNEANHTHLFFSVIPEVLLTEKGFRSYDALWSRVRSLGDDTRLNYRGVLIDLHRTPLGAAELLRLGQHLRQIHGVAYRWSTDAVSDARLRAVSEELQRLGIASQVRTYIRQVVEILDGAEQGAAEAAPQVAAGDTQPSWDA